MKAASHETKRLFIERSREKQGGKFPSVWESFQVCKNSKEGSLDQDKFYGRDRVEISAEMRRWAPPRKALEQQGTHYGNNSPTFLVFIPLLLISLFFPIFSPSFLFSSSSFSSRKYKKGGGASHIPIQHNTTLSLSLSPPSFPFFCNHCNYFF